MSNKVNVELSMNTTGYQEGINGAINSIKQYETETRKISASSVNFRKASRKHRPFCRYDKNYGKKHCQNNLQVTITLYQNRISRR